MSECQDGAGAKGRVKPRMASCPAPQFDTAHPYEALQRSSRRAIYSVIPQVDDCAAFHHRRLFRSSTATRRIIWVPRCIARDPVDPDLQVFAFKNAVPQKVFGHL